MKQRVREYVAQEWLTRIKTWKDPTAGGQGQQRKSAMEKPSTAFTSDTAVMSDLVSCVNSFVGWADMKKNIYPRPGN